MKLRIIPMNAYDGCIPVTVWMVQKYVRGSIFGKWVNIKGFFDKKKAVALLSLLYCIVKTNKNKTKWKERR